MVDFIEPNGYVQAHAERIPYGVAMSLGTNPPPNLSGPAVGCSNNGIRVAVLDGGLDVTHHDFDYCGLNADGTPKNGMITRCIGERFYKIDGTTRQQYWYNSRNGHVSQSLL